MSISVIKRLRPPGGGGSSAPLLSRTVLWGPSIPRPLHSPLREAPVSGTVERLRRPPDQAPLPAGEAAAEIAARRQRVLALQRELAQLKRTPSMHLLARQRIPRLEAEIKQVVTTLHERA